MKLAKIHSILGLLSARGLGIALQFLMQIAVGRLTGAYGVGLLQLCATWLSALGEFNSIGLPTHAMKTVSGFRSHYSRQQVKLYLRHCVGLVCFAWLAFAIFSTLIIAIIPETDIHSNRMSDTVFVVLVSIAGSIAYALMRLFADALKAYGRRNSVVFIENAGAPLVVILACIGFIGFDQAISARGVVLAFCLGFAIAAMLLFGYLVKTWRQMSHQSQDKQAQPPRPGREVVSFWGTGILSIGLINFPFVLLPLFEDLATIGVFAVAFKLTNTITSVIVMLAAVFGPQFAAKHIEGDKGAVWRLLLKSQAMSVAIYLPLIAVLILFVDSIAALFGSDFAGVSGFVYVLAAGQLVNAATGLPGVLLNMTDRGHSEFAINIIVFVTAILVGLVAGSAHGALGIAVTYALAIAAKNLISYFVALVSIYGLHELRSKKILKILAKPIIRKMATTSDA